MIYIDTSALAAYYCPEPLSEKAQQALDAADGRAVSWLAEVEFASALARKARAREMRMADARRLLALFQSHIEQGIFARLAIDSGHFFMARDWLASLTLELRALDALHVAIAARENCPLLTADVALARSCARAGVAARLIS